MCMNNKQREVQVLLTILFSELQLDIKYNWLIKEKFNTLDMEDSEWSDIEDLVLAIIGKIRDLK